jgi:Glycosyltransferase family 87
MNVYAFVRSVAGDQRHPDRVFKRSRARIGRISSNGLWPETAMEGHLIVSGVRLRRQPLRSRQLVAVAWRVAVGTAVVASAVVLTIKLMTSGSFLFDFNGDLYRAGHAILQGHDPYQPGFLAALAAVKHAGGAVSPAFAVPVYPAPALLAAVPFSLLPHLLAGLLFMGLMVAAMVLGLRMLGVRDWRCFVVALASWPFLFGLVVGALGPLIVLGMGLAWRFRARLWTPAIAIASVVVAKVFPWTVLVWLLVTRRFRTLALALLIGAVGVLAAWAVIGFGGMSEYPRMLANLSYVERGSGVSLVAALLGAGVPAGVAEGVALAVTALLLATAYRFARSPGGDRQALGLTAIAALTASPVVWAHYLVLLFVPIALASPTLSAIWFVPLLSSVLADPRTNNLTEMLFWIALEAAVAIHLCLSAAPRNSLERTRQPRGRHVRRSAAEQREPDLAPVPTQPLTSVLTVISEKPRTSSRSPTAPTHA